MARVRVTLQFDEKELGENWMNVDNLKLLLYSKGFSTVESLLQIISYIPMDDSE